MCVARAGPWGFGDEVPSASHGAAAPEFGLDPESHASDTQARFPSPHLRSFSALGFAPQQRPAFSLCRPRGWAVHAEGTREPALSTIQADSSRPRQQDHRGFQRTGPAPHLPHQAPHACLSRVASVPGLTSRQPNPLFGRCRPSFQSPCGREAWPAPASRGATRRHNPHSVAGKGTGRALEAVGPEGDLTKYQSHSALWMPGILAQVCGSNLITFPCPHSRWAIMEP